MVAMDYLFAVIIALFETSWRPLRERYNVLFYRVLNSFKGFIFA